MENYFKYRQMVQEMETRRATKDPYGKTREVYWVEYKSTGG